MVPTSLTAHLSLLTTQLADRVWRQRPVRLGYIDYLNCLPVYYGIEQGIIDLPVCVRRGTPAELNRLFLDGGLDITPISSIEYARHADQCVVLPDLSISAWGRVASILLFHRVPLPAVRRVALTSASATSVVLTQIILRERYGLDPEYVTMAPDLPAMLAAADAALVIGDDALLAHQAVLRGEFPGVTATDLGEEWRRLTGHCMVYALWVVRRDVAERYPDGVHLVARLLQESQAYSWAHLDDLVAEAVRRRGLPEPVVRDYFRTIRHRLGPAERAGLAAYLYHAHRIGALAAVPELQVWGEEP